MLNKTKKIDEMNNSAEEKLKAVLDLRKNFENNVNSCQQWFSEVEVIMSADVRLSSLNIVEDQLKKVNKYLSLTQLLNKMYFSYTFTRKILLISEFLLILY